MPKLTMPKTKEAVGPYTEHHEQSPYILCFVEN